MKLLLVLSSFCCAVVASAASWYVDNAATGSNAGTSWANAWTAWSNVVWASVSPGDTVYISGGTTSKVYREVTLDETGVNYVNVWCNKAGTAGNTIRITPGTDSGHNGKVVIDAQHDVRIRYGVRAGHNYTWFDGGPNTNFVIINGTNLQGYATWNPKEGAIAFYGGGTSNWVSGVLISNWNSGINMSDGLWHRIFSNRLERIVCEAGIGDASSAQTSWMNVHIHDNYVETCTDSTKVNGADGIKPTRGSTVERNTLVHRIPTDLVFPAEYQHADAFQTTGCGNWTRWLNNRVWGFYNTIFEFGVDRNSSNMVVFGNVVSYLYDTNLVGASHSIAEHSWDGAPLSNSFLNILVANNTFVDLGKWGVEWAKQGLANSVFPTVTNYQMLNNAFANIGGSGPAAPAINFGSYTNYNYRNAADEIRISHNLFYAGPTGSTEVVVAYQGTGEYDFTGAGVNITNSPGFVSWVGYEREPDLRPAYNSVMVDAGTNLTGLLLTFGITNAVDVNGTAWPADGAWNVGAYASEGSASASASPSPGVPISRGRRF